MQIVLRQFSGLGNQLFQYAAGRYYARRYGATLTITVDPAHKALDGSSRPYLLQHFSIPVPMHDRTRFERILFTYKPWVKNACAPWFRTLGIQVYGEPFDDRFEFAPDLPLEPKVKSLYMGGYWQTSGIVEQVAEELRSDLTFKEPAQGKTLEVLEQIRRSGNAVSLHVRRGDFTLAAEGKIALPLEYYSRAISIFKETLIDTTFFVFSDDINFVKENLSGDVAMVFVEHNDDYTAHEDLRLMSSCHHHIIANSTFSWWGAWLNPRLDKMVIAPRHWHLREDSYFPDLLPRDWMLLDSVTSPGEHSSAEGQHCTA